MKRIGPIGVDNDERYACRTVAAAAVVNIPASIAQCSQRADDA